MSYIFTKKDATHICISWSSYPLQQIFIIRHLSPDIHHIFAYLLSSHDPINYCLKFSNILQYTINFKPRQYACEHTHLSGCFMMHKLFLSTCVLMVLFPTVTTYEAELRASQLLARLFVCMHFGSYHIEL